MFSLIGEQGKKNKFYFYLICKRRREKKNDYYNHLILDKYVIKFIRMITFGR